MSLVPCSSNRNPSHLVIFNIEDPDDDNIDLVVGVNYCVPLDSISSRATQSKEAAPDIFKVEVPLPARLDSHTGFFFSKRYRKLFLFGSIDPPLEAYDQEIFVTKDAFSFHLHDLASNHVGRLEKCKDMEHAMHSPLIAQVSNCLYAIGCVNRKGSEERRLLFQKYHIKNNKWTRLNLFDIHRCDCDEYIRENPGYLPHVVIGSKLHVSIGNSSFTFDTKDNVWKDCNLFQNFWSKEKKNGLSPTNFYGDEVWYGAEARKKKTDKTFHSPPNFLARMTWAAAAKKKRMRKFHGGPPFGFYGRGIIWDKNVLLGVHYAPECLVVAFLMNENDRVVRSQLITLNYLVSHTNSLLGGATLVDLRDDYFGLVHPVPDSNDIDRMNLELVIFRIKKVAGADDDCFLDWEVISEEIVATNFSHCVGRSYSAFSV